MPDGTSRSIARDLIASIRREVDVIDAEILDLFSKRSELCAQIVRLKRNHLISPVSGTREAHVITRYTGALAKTTKKMWFAVFGSSKENDE